eukprot:TRINITY_DN125565_c0_g1_i1.p1 TRINITY_DN125565_c0_g1~~TRINITY_DN125565_c0_g1_i1.p1  ORF type:complete len:234 (+),score=26.28 TRINITY_DN125565_c0_g1_i1:65-766(+)
MAMFASATRWMRKTGGRRLDPSKSWQGFRDAKEINPFSEYQWISNPFPDHNMPRTATNVMPHKSLRAISYKDEKGWWHVIDAKGRGVGKLAELIGRLLQGKHKADYKAHRITGDSVIVVNAIHVFFPGHTWDTKIYRLHYNRKSDPRGPKVICATRMMMLNPSIVTSMAVKRMLPNNYLRQNWYRRFYCYPGAIHPHWGIPQVVVPVEKTLESTPTAFSLDMPTGSAAAPPAP